MKRLLFILVSLSIVMTLSASATTWTGGGGDPNWSNTGNWDTGIPTSADNIVIGSGASVDIKGFYAANGHFLTLNNGAAVNLETGSTYVGTSNTYLNTGSAISTTGFFRQNALIATGGSQVTATGNSVDHALLISNTGWVKFAGGSDLSVLEGEFRIGAPGSTTVSWYGSAAFGDVASGSIIDVHNGIITIQTPAANPNKYIAEIMAKIADGSIIGFGGAGTVSVAYDWNNSPWKPWGSGATIISAVPEPATLVILALGGLFLRKRRS